MLCGSPQARPDNLKRGAGSVKTPWSITVFPRTWKCYDAGVQLAFATSVQESATPSADEVDASHHPSSSLSAPAACGAPWLPCWITRSASSSVIEGETCSGKATPCAWCKHSRHTVTGHWRLPHGPCGHAPEAENNIKINI